MARLDLTTAGSLPTPAVLREEHVPNHRSAAKRQRQNEKRRQRNSAFKARMRRIMRNARSAADSEAEDKDALLAEAVRIVQKARSRKVIHPSTASRYVSRLMQRA
ncbi:MAG: 30S ribosomal protein S20 [Myxococcota bacterium]